MSSSSCPIRPQDDELGKNAREDIQPVDGEEETTEVDAGKPEDAREV